MITSPPQLHWWAVSPKLLSPRETMVSRIRIHRVLLEKPLVHTQGSPANSLFSGLRCTISLLCTGILYQAIMTTLDALAFLLTVPRKLAMKEYLYEYWLLAFLSVHVSLLPVPRPFLSPKMCSVAHLPAYCWTQEVLMLASGPLLACMSEGTMLTDQACKRTEVFPLSSASLYIYLIQRV